MHEISSGVYNLLKSTRRQPKSVSALLHSVEARDEHLEANLSTMLQSVHGTKQFWYTKQTELRCMIHTWGLPTLFLTFSCAEYESPEIDISEESMMFWHPTTQEDFVPKILYWYPECFH